MVYFDSHFHLTSINQKLPDYRLPENLIGIDVATDAGDLRERVMGASYAGNIFFSAGSGPWALEREDFLSIDDEIEKLKKEIGESGADAIGECGFDKHWNYGTIEAQRELFYRQVELAKTYDKAIIIHSRDASEYTEEALSVMGDRIIFHCFSYDKGLMYKALDKGAYISFSANISYKGNNDVREAAMLCPLDRLLYETDSPYLPPLDGGSRINIPERTEFTLAYLSGIRREGKDRIKERAIENLYSVLGCRESKVKRNL